LLQSARIGGDPAVRCGKIEAGDQVGIPDEFGAILQALVQEFVRIDELGPQAQLPERDQALVEEVIDQARLVTDIPLHDLEGGSQSRGDRALIECRGGDHEHGREQINGAHLAVHVSTIDVRQFARILAELESDGLRVTKASRWTRPSTANCRSRNSPPSRRSPRW
jgi:hypothetical protein